jgi:hypothetical protein
MEWRFTRQLISLFLVSGIWNLLLLLLLQLVKSKIYAFLYPHHLPTSFYQRIMFSHTS